jgi:hypothetical protein
MFPSVGEFHPAQVRTFGRNCNCFHCVNTIGTNGYCQDFNIVMEPKLFQRTLLTQPNFSTLQCYSHRHTGGYT